MKYCNYLYLYDFILNYYGIKIKHNSIVSGITEKGLAFEKARVVSTRGSHTKLELSKGNFIFVHTSCIKTVEKY